MPLPPLTDRNGFMPDDVLDFAKLRRAVDTAQIPIVSGRVVGVSDICIEAQFPGGRIGLRVAIVLPDGKKVPAEIASCEGTRAKLLPLAPVVGIGPGDRVVTAASGPTIRCGRGLLGRIIDPLGNVLDGGPPLQNASPWELDRPSPNPLSRRPVDTQMVTGVPSIDGVLALGQGQRVGLFAGPGAGKSTLLGLLARRSAVDACVICLVGERGREVREFLDNTLGPEGLKRSVVVLAPADAPLLLRVKALETATAAAEWFRARDRGSSVLLLVDSLTRVVRARRDMALSLGEAPARGGFPSSSFSALPGLLERAGCDANGSITGIYAVLTEDGEDPVAEEARSLLDGHIVLSEKLARAGLYPAVDVTSSVSRVMDAVVSFEHKAAARKLKRLLGAYRENEALIMMGAYARGSCPETDLVLDRKVAIDRFLYRPGDTPSPLDRTVSELKALVSDPSA